GRNTTMCSFRIHSARRRVVVLAPVALALLFAIGRSTPAAAKAAKSDFMYQDHAHDGKSCSQCKFFSPDKQNPDVGSCSIVEGSISSKGWCMAFTLQTNG